MMDKIDANLLKDLLVIVAALAALAMLVKQLFFSPKTAHRVIDRNKIEPQPLVVAAQVEFVPMPRFQEFEEYVHGHHEKLNVDLGQVHALIESRRLESQQQISQLQEALDERFREAITANNSSASKTHARIDALASVQGQLIGEMKHVAQGARDAAHAAQEAAIAAAKAGGRRP